MFKYTSRANHRYNILSRLPIKPLVCFLCVSKQWYAIITSSHFIIMHRNHSIETNRECIFHPQGRQPPFAYTLFSVDFPKKISSARPLKFINHYMTHYIIILDYCHGLVCLYKDDEEILI